MAESTQKDFRKGSTAKSPPRAVADAVGGTIIAIADIDAPPDLVYRALTTNEVERWWKHPDFYTQTGWSADLKVCGPWSVTVNLAQGPKVEATGEFAELDPPRRIVMTRRFSMHPLLGTRETTITYRLEPIPSGTRVTVRDEGFVGRGEAAYGNAQHWESVLSWLDQHFRTT
jgi:uncharacterized protein YndB with AHSA1/START domain